MSLAFKKAGIKDTDREAVARFVEIKDFGASMTSQSPAEEVDINRIVSKIQKGKPVLVSNGEPFYGDVSEFKGLAESFQMIQDSEDLFMQYPADIREKFGNDPVQFVEFLEDPNNYEDALKMGLVKPRPPVIPPVPEPVGPKA